MTSRRVRFVFAFLLATVLYAAFWYYVAPRIVPMQPARLAAPVPRTYDVRIVERPAAREGRVADEGPVALVSRPGSIRDMLAEMQAFDTPEFEPAPPRDDVPGMNERLTLGPPPPDTPLEPDRDRLRMADMRVVEIGTDAARRDIEVPRRLASPSPVDVLEEGELPVLRGSATDFDQPLRFSPAGGGLLAESLAPVPVEPTPEAEGRAPSPEREAVVLPTPVEPPEVSVVAETERRLVSRPRVEEVRAEQQSRYEFMDDLLDISVETYAAPGQATGYFRLRMKPRPDARFDPLPKDVTFVIDASRSISQRRLDLTTRGVLAALDAIRPEDRFNIVLFRDRAISFQPEPVPGSAANKVAAEAFLSGVEARGQTDIYRAMLPVIRQAPRPGVPGVVFVMTDGHPTVGIQDSRVIINALSADNARHGVFAFSGGRAVNRYLLDMLAYRNKGTARVEEDIAGMDGGLPRFFGQLRDPLLTDVRVRYSGVDDTAVFPQEIPDFFRDRGVTVYGRFDTAGQRDFVLRLSGRAGHRDKEVVFRARLDDPPSGAAAIARNWAFNKAYHLVGEISRAGETPELLEALRVLERRYGVRTPYGD